MEAVLTKNLRRSLERLQQASDDAVAVLTVPTTLDAKSHLTRGAAEPAVDLALWTAHVRYARHRDPEALETLVDHYRPHTEALARSLYRHGESLQDLTQTAFEALVVALQRFEPGRGRPFLAYARPTITGAIRRHYRDLGWAMRIPRRVHELAGPVRDAREMLVQDLGRQPLDVEVADFLGVSESDLREVMAAQEARQPGSLDAVDPVTKQSSQQHVGEPDPGFASAENHTALVQAMELLTEEDRRLLQQYFYDGRTQADIARDCHCSQMQISRLLDSAVRRLRQRIVGAV